jgi:hypothetical protein
LTTKATKTTKTLKPSKTIKKASVTKKTTKKSQNVESASAELVKVDGGHPAPELVLEPAPELVLEPAPEPVRATNCSTDDAKKASITSPDSEVRINLSSKLRKKLTEQAEDEGILLSDYIEELLAEASVIRAWELVEKKLHMRSGQNQGSQGNHNPRNNRNNQGRNKNHNNSNHNGNGNGNGNRRNMNNARYQNLMEDKASFLEYVRNQERDNNRS